MKRWSIMVRRSSDGGTRYYVRLEVVPRKARLIEAVAHVFGKLYEVTPGRITSRVGAWLLTRETELIFRADKVIRPESSALIPISADTARKVAPDFASAFEDHPSVIGESS